jgi:excisionase family DNA binding protein
MSARVLIPLPGIGTLELTREAYEAALRPVTATEVVPTAGPATAVPAPSTPELVDAKVLAARLSLPISCVYEYARNGRIPCVRAGKHVRFNPSAVLAVLSATGRVTGGHA